MAAPGFGFSAGDFIAAATLIAKVTKALKDAGGAREEYQALVKELGLLQEILAKFQSDSEATDSGDAYSNLARQQTKVTIVDLAHFLEKMSKFHSDMGEKSRSGWHRGIPRKTQWAVHYAAEVEKMRARLGTQLQMINLALLIDGQQSTRNQRKPITSANDPGPVAKDDAQSVIRHECLPKLDRVLSRLEHLEAFSVGSAINADELSSEVFVLGAVNRSLFLRVDQSSNEGLARRIGNIGGSQLNQSDVAIRIRTQAPANRTTVAAEEDIKRLLVALLRAMTKSARDFLLSLWKLLPQCLVFFRVVTRLTLSREPMLAAADCINFEDMIGRRFTLSFQYYRHWPNFEAFLRQQFRDAPGKKHVREQHYHLMHENDIVAEKRWPMIIEPGSNVSMSGLLLAWTTSEGKCPRSSCSGDGRRRGKTPFLTCNTCSLKYGRDLRELQPRTKHREAMKKVFLHLLLVYDDGDEKYFKKTHCIWEPEGSANALEPVVEHYPNIRLLRDAWRRHLLFLKDNNPQ